MIEIIPAIDIIGGQCVRLTQGDYAQQTTYYKDPLDAARQFEDMGVQYLHMVDLDGAKQASPANLKTLERIATRTTLRIEYGGGIKSEESLRRVLNCGATRAICGSIAVSAPELFGQWLTEFGAEAVVLGADARDGKVAVNGWLESSSVTVEQLIERFMPMGLKYAICTDISRDGMLLGPSFEWYDSLQRQFPKVEIIVSGGISSAEDIEKLIEMKLRNVIVGKAYYEGKITANQITNLTNTK